MYIAVRGSSGVAIKNGGADYEDVPAFTKDNGKSCKAMAFSPDGRYFSWISGPRINIVSCDTWRAIAVIERPKVCAIQFSPKGTYLMTWEPFIGKTPFSLNDDTITLCCWYYYYGSVKRQSSRKPTNVDMGNG